MPFTPFDDFTTSVLDPAVECGLNDNHEFDPDGFCVHCNAVLVVLGEGREARFAVAYAASNEEDVA